MRWWVKLQGGDGQNAALWGTERRGPHPGDPRHLLNKHLPDTLPQVEVAEPAGDASKTCGTSLGALRPCPYPDGRMQVPQRPRRSEGDVKEDLEGSADGPGAGRVRGTCEGHLMGSARAGWKGQPGLFVPAHPPPLTKLLALESFKAQAGRQPARTRPSHQSAKALNVDRALGVSSTLGLDVGLRRTQLETGKVPNKAAEEGEERQAGRDQQG